MPRDFARLGRKSLAGARTAHNRFWGVPDTMDGSSQTASTTATEVEVGRRGRGIVAIVATLACLFALAATAASASAETTTYTAKETVPVPPASNFAGSGGGDGWAVALSNTAVYNVFHHEDAIQVACHLQSTAEPCEGWPKTITEPGTGDGFLSQPQPGLYLDQHTGKLYVYATRQSDSTGGVVCVETSSEAADPFCGFTELTGKGEAPPTTSRGISGMSNPMLIGTHLYSFNFAAGTQSGSENELTCFDVSTDMACEGQPYDVAIGAGAVTTNNNEPIGETAAIADKAIIPIEIEGSSWLSCFDDATKKSCAGQWPVKLGFNYLAGAPFPMLSATGATTGLCLPTGTDQCFNLQGEPVTTPEKMAEAIPGTEEWNGPGFVLGPRVYIPDGNTDEVHCFDYSTGKGCANFPKTFQNLGLLYTVNPDPQRPTCIWVNSDDGSAQIQDFDAYTGEACGQGTIRVLASQFVVPKPQCTPASYISLQVLQPARNTYTSGSVAFADGDGNPIGLEERALDEAGATSLTGLELNTPTGLPQFLFTLNGETKEIGEVEIQLTWTANYDATCIGEKTTATEPKPETKPTPEVKPAPVVTPAPTPTPTAKSGVLAFSSAHLASSPRACVAAGSYLASVSGKNIASVSFTLGGRRLKTLRKPTGHGAYTLSVPVQSGKVEHLTIHVTFTSASSRHSQTITKTLARCAVAHHVTKPRFTG
jgi:hypothetical protein